MGQGFVGSRCFADVGGFGIDGFGDHVAVCGGVDVEVAFLGGGFLVGVVVGVWCVVAAVVVAMGCGVCGC